MTRYVKKPTVERVDYDACIFYFIYDKINYLYHNLSENAIFNYNLIFDWKNANPYPNFVN